MGIVSPVSLWSIVRGREVQPLVALYPTVRLSPCLETGPEKYPLQGVDPRFHLICTLPRRATPLVPLSSWWLGDIGLTPGDWSELLSRVATPGTTRSCLSPGGLLSWSPYPRVNCFPATRILSMLLCVFCVYWALCVTTTTGKFIKG